MITNVRVDQRLIHGQVTQGWAYTLHLQRIAVLSTRLMRDPLGQKILRLGVPPALDVHFLDVEQLGARWQEWSDDGVPTLVLTDDLSELLLAVEQGITISSITLGNLHGEAGCHPIARTVHCSDAELEILRHLYEHGVQLQACSGAADSPEPIEKNLWIY